MVSNQLATYATGTPIDELWKAFDTDYAQAQKQFGQQAGLGGAFFYRIRGVGTVQTTEKNRILLKFDDSDHRVSLEIGVVVDNTVRESIGIKASQFTNSQEFNALSAELNRQVEEDVIAPNREQLQPGAIVRFVGCAKLSSKSDLDPLRIIPIQLNVTRPSASSSTESVPKENENDVSPNNPNPPRGNERSDNKGSAP